MRVESFQGERSKMNDRFAVTPCNCFFNRMSSSGENSAFLTVYYSVKETVGFLLGVELFIVQSRILMLSWAW